MHDPERDIRDIPLSQLELSSGNVRKTPADASAFTEIKASIAAHGLLENLITRAMEPGTDGRGGGRGVRVLVLSPQGERIAGTFARENDTIVVHDGEIDPAFLAANAIDMVVSYGYRRILKCDVVAARGGRIVNLHISLLPWNRGADPNFWSFFYSTPKGVTIHEIDEGVDTGALLAQREVRFAAGETLATSYEKLRRDVEALFDATWRDIKDGRCEARSQTGAGSYHRARDKEMFMPSLPNGWETPVADVEALGRRVRARRGRGER